MARARTLLPRELRPGRHRPGADRSRARTNADAAIAAGGRQRADRGAIRLADSGIPRSLACTDARLRSRRCARGSIEVSCADDGVGVNARLVDRRLGALRRAPERAASAACSAVAFGTCGWLRERAHRRGARRTAVESWFFPAAGDDPYAYLHVRDAAATTADLRSESRCPARGSRCRLRSRMPARTVADAGLAARPARPILEDPYASLWLELPPDTAAGASPAQSLTQSAGAVRWGGPGGA